MKGNLRGKFLSIIASCLSITGGAFACDVRGVSKDAPNLCGKAEQGGFVYGESEWRLDSETAAIRIQSHGNIFVMAIPMDAPKRMTLKFCNGETCKKYDYEIAQRKYKEEQAVKVAGKFVEYPPEVQKRIDSETEKITAARDVADAEHLDFTDFRYPFAKKYPTSGTYGDRRVFNGKPRSPHKGLDIAAPEGTAVHPIGRGRVVLALDSYMAGKMVLIDHGYGVFSVYMHLDRIMSKTGDIVDFKSVIGTVGATGRVSGAHLHLGLYVGQTPIDPALVL